MGKLKLASVLSKNLRTEKSKRIKIQKYKLGKLGLRQDCEGRLGCTTRTKHCGIGLREMQTIRHMG